MWLAIAFLCVALAGAVAGVLIYRNNLKKMEATVLEITQKYNDLKHAAGK